MVKFLSPRAQRAFGIALVCAGLVSLAPVSLAIGGHSTDHDPLKPVPGAPEPGPAIPELTNDDRAAASSLVMASPAVRQLLEGRRFVVDRIGVWTTYDNVKIGVAMVLRLERPASFAMKPWPLLKYERSTDGGPDRFEARLIRLSARDVTEVDIRVDLRSRKVVGIGPGGRAAKISVAPGTPIDRSNAD